MVDQKGDLYLFDSNSVSSSFSFNSSAPSCSSLTANNITVVWHNRLGHMPFSKMHLLEDDLPNVHIPSNNIPCEICPLARQHRLPFPNSSIRTSSPFEMIPCDIWGPFAIATPNGNHYFLTIVDDYTRCTWIFLMKFKFETRFFLESFFSLVEIQFASHIKILRSENGPEFNMVSFYSTKGVLHQTSYPNTP